MHLKQCHTSKYVFFYAYKLHYAEKIICLIVILGGFAAQTKFIDLTDIFELNENVA